jgi:predicted membrane channel-forming protein YqfA (hemolysin III family)
MAQGSALKLGRGFALLLGLLVCLALLAFRALWHLDGLSRNADAEVFFAFEPAVLNGIPGTYTDVVAAILAIIVTVVSIVLQLSAARFAGITRMFLRDPVNVVVIGYYVVVCMLGLWVSPALRSDHVPTITVVTLLVLTTLSVALMVPYFGYVFHFLEPRNIIVTLRDSALQTAKKGALARGSSVDPVEQENLVLAMEELTDIVSSSISNKDKLIASQAVDALRDLLLGYLELKPAAEAAWFQVGPGLARNPDFVAMDPESLLEQSERRTWVEWKILRQYLGIYNEALATMRDMTYLIAIDTRYIGEAAVKVGDEQLIGLVYRFMNSYLRSALNGRDVRTAYNVLNQYRLYVECLMKAGRDAQALEGVAHMLYYGHVSFDMKLTFVTETVAYDISALCQEAHRLGAKLESAMLDRLLELDRPLRAQSQEAALVGVRKAQAKLGAYYLSLGEHQLSLRVALDMRGEPEARLQMIEGQLRSVGTKEFWEVTDRGRNFEYMPEAERAELGNFFALVGRA